MSVIAEMLAKVSVEGVDAARKELGKMDGAIGNLSKSAKKWGMGLTAGVTTPLLLMGNAAADAASDVQESMNKVSVVFGDSSTAVLDFSKTTASALGVSQSAALDASGMFGNMFVTMGLNRDAAADMSTSLVQVAADLGSFNNVDPTEMLDKLRSGLVGESEPLRAVGILLDETTVANKALEMGLAATAKELTQADKLQARYALILEQSKTAQGDFARTADGAANSSRIMSATLADLSATIGQQLLPIKMKLIGVVGQLVSWFQSLAPGTQELIVKIGIMAAALGPLLIALGMVAPALGIIGAALGVLLSPIGLIVAAVVALAAAWATNFGGIRDKTQAVIDWIKPYIQSALAAIQGWWKEHGQSIIDAVRTAFDFIKSIVQGVFAYLQQIFLAFKSAFEGDWRGFGEHLRQAWDMVWNTVVDLLKTIVPKIIEGVRNLAQKILTVFKETDWLELGKAVIRGLVQGLKDGAEFVRQTIIGIVGAAIDAVKGFLGIHSPSRVAADEIGAPWVQGIVKGLLSGQNGLEKAARSVVGGLPVANMSVNTSVGALPPLPTTPYAELGANNGKTFASAWKRAVMSDMEGFQYELAARLMPAFDEHMRRRYAAQGVLP